METQTQKGKETWYTESIFITGVICVFTSRRVQSHDCLYMGMHAC